MIFAKLSTAITIPFGPVVDSTGAEYTGAAVGDVKICKNAGSPAALNGSATLTHKEVGMYELVLTTSDISAVGQVTVQLSKTTYLAPPVHLIVLPAKVYDSLIGGTDNLEVDAIQWLGTAILAPGTAGTPDVNAKLIGATAQTGRDIGASVLLAASQHVIVDSGTVTTVTNQLTAAQIATGVWQDATAGDFTVANSIGKALYIANIAPGAAGGHFISGSNAGTTTFAALTVTGVMTLTGGLTVSAATSLTTLATSGTTTLNALTVTNATTLTGNVTLGGSLYVTTTTTLHGAVALDSTLVVTGTTTHTGAVTLTAGITANTITGTLATVTTLTNLPAITASWLTAAGIASAALDGKGDWNTTTPPTAASVADAVWDEATSGHTTTGSEGKAIIDILAGASAASIADAVWDEVLDTAHEVGGSASVLLQAAGGAADPLLNAVPGAYGDGTAGKALGEIAGVKAQTDLLQFSTGSGVNCVFADNKRWRGTDLPTPDTAGYPKVTVKNGVAGGEILISSGKIALVAGGLDSVLVESNITAGAGLTNDAGTQLTSINARQALAAILSACAAVLAGAATTDIAIKPAGLPAGNTRIDATVDADGNRSAVALKVPT